MPGVLGEERRMSEQELIQSAKRGESEGVVGLMNLHRGIIFMYWKKARMHLSGFDNELVDYVGMIAIWKAAKTYDGRAKFTTYLGWKIRAEISLIARERVRGNLGATAFSDYVDGDQAEIVHIAGRVTPDRSTEIHEDEDIQIKRAMRFLDDRDRLILTRRAQGHTLTEVGAMVGVCRERVRQLQYRAIKAIRERLCVGQS